MAEESLHELHVPTIPDFAYVFVRKDLRFTRNGMAEIVLQVPWQYREHAIYLLDHTAVPIELHMKPCQKTLRSIS